MCNLKRKKIKRGLINSEFKMELNQHLTQAGIMSRNWVKLSNRAVVT